MSIKIGLKEKKPLNLAEIQEFCGRYKNQTVRTDFTYSEDGYIIDVARDIVDEADNTLQLI